MIGDVLAGHRQRDHHRAAADPLQAVAPNEEARDLLLRRPPAEQHHMVPSASVPARARPPRAGGAAGASLALQKRLEAPAREQQARTGGDRVGQKAGGLRQRQAEEVARQRKPKICRRPSGSSR